MSVEAVSNESKEPRSLPEINADYQQMCAKAGQLQYIIETQKKDLELINKGIRDLNFEATSLKRKEADEAAKGVSNES